MVPTFDVGQVEFHIEEDSQQQVPVRLRSTVVEEMAGQEDVTGQLRILQRTRLAEREECD